MSNTYRNVRREAFLADQRAADQRALDRHIDKLAARVTTKNREPMFAVVGALTYDAHTDTLEAA